MVIKLYTNPQCPYSDKARRFFKKKRKPFEELTLFKEGKTRLEVIEISGQMGTPVIDINGEIVVGFNRAEITSILKKK